MERTAPRQSWLTQHPRQALAAREQQPVNLASLLPSRTLKTYGKPGRADCVRMPAIWLRGLPRQRAEPVLTFALAAVNDQ